MDKARHLTASCAWDSSLHLPVTSTQLMRPGIGQDVSCTVHNTYRPSDIQFLGRCGLLIVHAHFLPHETSHGVALLYGTYSQWSFTIYINCMFSLVPMPSRIRRLQLAGLQATNARRHGNKATVYLHAKQFNPWRVCSIIVQLWIVHSLISTPTPLHNTLLASAQYIFVPKYTHRNTP